MGRTDLPDVSVVVPMRNNATTVAEQLTALRSQDFDGSWEVIVVDNGSTDGGRGVVEGLASTMPGLQLIAATGTAGASYARNEGARVARGALVAFTDADDVVSRQWLRALVDGLESADMVGGPNDEALLNPEYARTWGDPPIPTERLNVVYGYLPNARGNNVAVSKRVFEALGGWNEEYRFAEDIEFSWRAINAGYRLSFVPEAVVHYRRRHDMRSLARQQFFRGRQTHRQQLIADFARFGLTLQPETARVRRVLGGLLADIPAIFSDRGARGRFVAGTAYGTGWLIGARQRWKRRELLRRAESGR